MRKLNRTQLLIILTLLVALWLRVYRLIDLPPGLHYDEAANGILSGDIGLRGARPIFITSYTGKETLFFYLAGFLMRFVGESVFTLRLASAFVGVLSVAGVYWLGMEIGRILKIVNGKLSIDNWQFTIDNSLLSLLLAILLTTHFPHLIFSRLGFRAITQPLLQGLTVAATLHGLRTRKTGSFVAAGFFLGLTGYTYLAARLFPILFGLFLLPLLRNWWRQISVLLGTATLVMVPLGRFFWQNPDTFWVRIGQVGGGNTTISDYANSFVRSLAMLGVDGDPYWRFNIPGKPLLELGWFGMWLIGIGVLIWFAVIVVRDRLSKAVSGNAFPKRDGIMAILLLLLATPLVMILPTALALDEIVPSNLRAIGLYPFVLVPLALVLAWLAQQLPTLGREAVAPVLLGAMLLLSGVDYFDHWGTRSDAFFDSDADLVALAAYVDEHADEYDELYVGSLHYRHPTMAFASTSYDRVKWLVGSDAVVIPEGKRGLLAFPQSSPPPDWLLAQEPLNAPLGPDGKVLFWAWDSAEITPPSIPGQFISSSTNFSSFIQLDGYDILNAATATPTLRLFWTVLGTPPQGFAPFVHIEDTTGFRVVQAETIAYAAEQWKTNEQVIQQLVLPLPAGSVNGAYTVVVGLFAGSDRLALVDSAGKFAGNTVRLPVQLAGNGETPQIVDGQLVELAVADGVLLDAVSVATEAEGGATIPITLNWRMTKQPATDSFTVRLNSAETPLATIDFPTQPTTPFYATQRLSLRLPNDAAGQDGLSITFNDTTSVIAAIDITPVERQLAQPDFALAADADFGEQLALVGYTVGEPTNGKRSLTLVWQAQEDISADYTVFIHVLNPDGSCCIWQQDSQPQQGSYPTSRWVAGEYVIDDYTIEFDGAAAVEYPLEIGLYRAENGQRLQVIGGDDHLFLEPITVAP